MVAVSKHSSSVSAVKWALSNKLVVEGGSIKLVHVRPPVRSIPTPMGNFVPVEQVSPEIVTAYMRDIQSNTEQHLQVHQHLCDKWKVQGEFVIVESDSVTTALLEQISRLRVKKFIMGASTRNAIIRKLKGTSIPEYIAKHASESCTVLVVSKGRLVSVKESSWLSSSPGPNVIAESRPCDSDLNDNTGTEYLGSHANALPGRIQNHFYDPLMVQGDTGGFISQPLPIQREKAASTINRMHGRSNSGLPQNRGAMIGPKGSRIFLSPFWSPDLPLKAEFSLFRKQNKNIDGGADLTMGHHQSQSSHEANSPVLPSNAVGILEKFGACKLDNAGQQESSEPGLQILKVNVAAPVSANSLPYELNDGLLNSSMNRPDISAAVQINRIFQSIDEDKQMTAMISNRSVGGDIVALDKHNYDDQPTAENDLAKLKHELEMAQWRVMRAEEAASMATKKARESYDYAKEEAKRREEALFAAQLAKNEAAEESRKFDEALVSTEDAKSSTEKEAQWRKEAEDLAHQEALIRQEAMVALVQAKTKYREYSYEDMEAATNCFAEDNQIGEGGYGAVYKGKLHHTTVAIKVLKKGGVQGPQEFQQEVELLSHVHHPHMVLLLGACPEKGCLVYEYLANGSLEDRLLCKGNTQPIPWHSRFRIAAEVATALLFLHSSKPDPIVHRDLKPANILLDQNFVSKVGDVGLARLAPGIISYSVTEYRETVPVGTFAYIDPEYQRTGIFCPRSDVYALGIVMLQLLTGKGPIGVTNIVENALEGNALNEVLDSTAGNWPIHEATELAHLAIKCSALRRKERLDLEMCVLPKLVKLRAFADEYASQMLWSKQTIMDNGLIVPSFFLCPIVKEAMEDPHIAADGFTYEYGAIKQWLQDHNTSPMTNLKLSHKHLTPNHSLRSAIFEWRQRVLCMSV